MIDLLLWIIVGSVAGWVGSLVMMKRAKRKSSASDVFIGVGGAVLGGSLIAPRMGIHALHPELFSLGGLLVALVAAVMLVVVVNLVRGHSAR
ncbi:MAG TPA: hypothetical protein VFL86_16855 [Burkholderiaceae bacterium]|nr:hypothetical protein [Burkholderiaceae bacterium]